MKNITSKINEQLNYQLYYDFVFTIWDGQFDKKVRIIIDNNLYKSLSDHLTHRIDRQLMPSFLI